MRPPEEILGLFYDLAECDQDKRLKAVISVVEASKTNSNYCVERLIIGLASTRAAARLGFSNALTLVLSDVPEEWDAGRLLKLIDNKLDLRKAESSTVAIGQHLAYTAMINSGSFHSAAFELVSRELRICDKYAFYGMAVCDSIARLALQLDEPKFVKLIWPQVMRRVTEPLGTLLPQWILFILLTAAKFRKTMKGKVKFIDVKGQLVLDHADSKDMVALLKKAPGSVRDSLGVRLLAAARTSGKFGNFYENYIEPWLKAGDSQKTLKRTLQFVETLLTTEHLSSSEYVAVFSPNFFGTVYSVKTNKDSRYALPLVQNILKNLTQSIENDKWARTDLLTLLDRLAVAGGGKFDDFFRADFGIAEKALLKLDLKGIEKFLSKESSGGAWAVKRIARVFSSWPAALQQKVLLRLVRKQPHTEEDHYAFCDCIDSLFSMNVRAGKSAKITIAETCEEMLKSVLSSYIKDVVLPKTDVSTRSLSTLALMLRLWSLTAPDEQERLSYIRDFDETVDLSKLLASDKDTENLSVLIDLLLSIVSRPRRFHRSVVHFVFAAFLSQFKLENILHIFEAINLPHDEAMKPTDEDDSEGDGESDEDGMENEIVSSVSGENEAESSSESDENLENIADEVFRGKLEKALRSAAASSSSANDNKDSVSSDLSDDTMFRFDEALAEVFQQRKKGSGQTASTVFEQTQQFRLKCLDLLLLVASHEDSKELAVEMLVPLLETARESFQRKNGPVVVEKAISLIEIIVKQKRGTVSEQAASKILEKLVLTSSQIVNPALKGSVGKISSFLFSCGHSAEEKTTSDVMRIKIDNLFTRYMTQEGNHIIGELVTAPFQCYPHAFLDSLERIIDFGFNEEARIFRRTEALSTAVAFMRKDVVKEGSNADKKFWKRIANCLGTHMHNHLSKLRADDLKPRFFAFAVRLLTAFTNVASSSRIKQLHELLDDDLGALSGNEEFWKFSGKRKQQLNAVSQSICGRNSLAAIKHLHNLIKKAMSS